MGVTIWGNPMDLNHEIDAIDLMLQELMSRYAKVQHKAAYRGYEKELDTLQHELIAYLERKRRDLLLWKDFSESFPA